MKGMLDNSVVESHCGMIAYLPGKAPIRADWQQFFRNQRFYIRWSSLEVTFQEITADMDGHRVVNLVLIFRTFFSTITSAMTISQ